MYFLNQLNNGSNYEFIIMRCVLLFLISIILIRYGNRRYQLNTAFDYLFLIILGSLISRGINGTATLASTLISAISLVVTHKLIAILTCHFSFLEPFFKGQSNLIVKNGKILHQQLKRFHLTERDIYMQMRSQLHMEKLDQIREAYLESNGLISFVYKVQLSKK